MFWLNIIMLLLCLSMMFIVECSVWIMVMLVIVWVFLCCGFMVFIF